MDFFGIGDSDQRAKLVSLITDLISLLYHILIFFVFLKIKVYIMFFYNIFSISVFAILLLHLRKVKNYIPVYFAGLFEVILHQILADYFLGTDTCFHYFILLMGLLPYFIFGNRYKLSVPVTILATLTFIVLENMAFVCKYPVAPNALRIIKNTNISITVFAISIIIFFFTLLVAKTEKNLEYHNKQLESEIKRAAIIQQNFFKQNVSEINEIKAGYFSSPMSGVSGDIYDFYKTDGKLDGAGIFDVSGHGISSGLVTMLVKNIIQQEFYNNRELELWEILTKINDRVIAEKGDIENYLTGLIIRIYENKIEIASAGHPMPVIYRQSTGICELVNLKKNSIGAIGFPDMPVFYCSEMIDFESGDELVLYSDGICDVENAKHESLGISGFINMISASVDKNVDEQINIISTAINDFRNGQPQNDDITFMILKR